MISGANRGIGRTIATRLLDSGFRLSLGVRHPETIGSQTDERRFIQYYEATDPASAAKWVKATIAHFGRIDAVVANAGIYREVAIDDGSESDLDDLWNINVKGPFRLVRAAWPYLKSSGCGRVIAIASMSGKRVRSARATGYAMSKFALMALVHGARHSGWPHGIRATAICPAYVATDMTSKVVDVPPEQMTSPEMIADLVSVALRAPNTAVIPEIPVSWTLEP